MKGILLLLAVLLLAGCTRPTSTGDGASDDSVLAPGPCSASQTTDGKPFASQTGCACPWKDACGTPAADASLTWLGDAQVKSNGTITVAIRNDGSGDVTYDEDGCPADAWTSAGRQLWAPCGVDYRAERVVGPGAQATGFTWRAVECLATVNNGYATQCSSERPLAPGTYDVRLRFCRGPLYPCDTVFAGAAVEVVAA